MFPYVLLIVKTKPFISSNYDVFPWLKSFIKYSGELRYLGRAGFKPAG